MNEREALQDRFRRRYTDCMTLLDAVDEVNAREAFAPLFDTICERAKQLQSETASIGDNIAEAVAIGDASAWQRNLKFISQCFDRCFQREQRNGVRSQERDGRTARDGCNRRTAR